MNLSDQYQQKTEKEHILHAPDTYIGSIEHSMCDMDLFDEETQRMVSKNMEFVPALYKLFDEGIVNSRDHVVRMSVSTQPDKCLVTQIDITVATDGTITIENNGDGIDVAQHPDTGLWIPEMIFGHLRTSTNYNQDEKKIVGGKNGFGFKLVLIWSTFGSVETLDHRRKLLYRQEFHDNLNVLSIPKITPAKATAKPFTRVTFRPDYHRLGFPNGLSADTLQLLKKRAYDIAAITDAKVRVSFNGVTIPVKQFSQYASMYSSDAPKIHESPNPRWEYAVILSPSHEFRQVSFVNGIATTKGGKHVEYIMGQITRQICDLIEKKQKIRVSPQTIKEQLMLFLRCDIENPSFESQSKDFLSTPVSKFGSTCEISSGFIKKIMDLGVANTACSVHEIRENSKTAKRTNGTKTKHLRGIEKLDDAILAGSSRSNECILILCEGDSAKSGIISGLTKKDRDTIGIYPLKGKLMNVRDQSIRKIAENKEIADIIKILGLEIGKVYANREQLSQQLRYGRVMMMCDQDVDGSHIKGLCINLFHSHWPSLVTIGDFLSFMNTPILRATNSRTHEVQVFYTDGEYQLWRQTQLDRGVSRNEGGLDAWKIKYFKGLGTSTAAEFKEYMSQKKIISYSYTGKESDDMLDIMFHKSRADDRKNLLLNVYQPASFLDKNQANVSYEEFVKNELLHFSAYDCERSIPNMVDGLKTSFRKILYCAFKRRLTSEIKVAQFSGYVSEHAEYHHGEQSLNGAIVSMAQNFVGSNNIPLLEPKGQFGSRLLGGDDSASERYIFTHLSPLARMLFPEEDDAVLNYLNEDGHSIEPDHYVPILPFILVNGSMGIGTGFSSNIPSFSPEELVDYLLARLGGSHTETNTETQKVWTPSYNGFKGTIQPLSLTKFLIKGVYEKIGPSKIRITELPVGTWTTPYKVFLESLTDGTTDKTGKKKPPILKDVVSHSTDTCVDITVEFAQTTTLEEWEKELYEEGRVNGVDKHLKLTTTVTTTNMHLFNIQGKLHKYETVQDILEAYIPIRLDVYEKRKAYLLSHLNADYERLSDCSRFVQELLDDRLDLRKKTGAQIEELLTAHQFRRIGGDFKYLTKMSMDAVTTENVAALLQNREKVKEQRQLLESKTCESLWIEDLHVFDKKYREVKKLVWPETNNGSSVVDIGKKKTGKSKK